MRETLQASFISFGLTALAWVLAHLVGWHPLLVFALAAFVAAAYLMSDDVINMPLAAAASGGFLLMSPEPFGKIAGVYLVVVALVSPFAEQAIYDRFKSGMAVWNFFLLVALQASAAATLSKTGSMLITAGVSAATLIIAIFLWYLPIDQQIRNDPKFRD